MALRRKRSELVVASDANGLVVRGNPAAVERLADRARAALATIDPEQALAVATNIKSALEQVPRGAKGDQPVLFEFSPRAVELLRQYDAIPASDGFFRSIVHDGKGIAGNLDWKPVTPGPELVQLQTAAITLALQASIKNLADAVERVEQKVDELRDLIRTDQVGQVVAHHRVLTPLANSVIAGGTLTATDWDSVDDLRPQILATVERTRLYLGTRLQAADAGWTAQSRSKETGKLVEAQFSESIALLAAAEHNLASWHRLRVERVKTVEPQHLEQTVVDVERELTEQRRDDELLIASLAEFLERAGSPTGYEGLEPIARRRLAGHIRAMNAAVVEFAHQRVLESPKLDLIEMPTLTETLTQVKDVATGRAKQAGGWVKDGTSRVTGPVASAGRRAGIGRGSGTPDPPSELRPGDAPPH